MVLTGARLGVSHVFVPPKVQNAPTNKVADLEIEFNTSASVGITWC